VAAELGFERLHPGSQPVVGPPQLLDQRPEPNVLVLQLTDALVGIHYALVLHQCARSVVDLRAMRARRGS